MTSDLHYPVLAVEGGGGDQGATLKELSMPERWLPISGYEGLYEVSDRGRVRSLKPPRGDGLLKGSIDHKGYHRIRLSKDRQSRRFFAHRLVCAAFHGPQPEGTECGHRNGKPLDNTAENLGWITRSQNTLDAIKHGTHVPPYIHPKTYKSRLSDEDVQAIHSAARIGISQRVLARKYDVSYAYIYKILSGKKRAIKLNFRAG